MDNSEKYKEYYDLSQKEYDTLVETNYWRMKHKYPMIEVPKVDIEYHKAFAKAITKK